MCTDNRDPTRRADVPAVLSGERLDRVSAELFGEFSRSQLTRWIKTGALLVDGQRAVPKHRVVGGESLALTVEAVPHAADLVPQSVPFEVVFEDESLLVIDKPAGLVVHPGAGNADGTLVNGLLAHRGELAQLPRAGLIHRLDKDTSGLLIVAGNTAAFHELTAALARRDISREYIAVSEGVMTGGREIDAPIGRDPDNRLKQRVIDSGRPALSKVRVRERFRAHTLVDVSLDTGRTHQIRVHLASIGYPLVGDSRYGARGRLPPVPSAELVAGIRAFRRQALHAVRLRFEHPLSKAALSFEAPLPADLLALLAVLREDAREH